MCWPIFDSFSLPNAQKWEPTQIQAKEDLTTVVELQDSAVEVSQKSKSTSPTNTTAVITSTFSIQV